MAWLDLNWDNLNKLLHMVETKLYKLGKLESIYTVDLKIRHCITMVKDLGLKSVRCIIPAKMGDYESIAHHPSLFCV